MNELIIISVLTIPFLVAAILIYQSRKAYLKTKTNEIIGNRVVLSLAVPRNNDKSPLAAEQLFSSLHGIGLNKAKSPDHFSMEIAAGNYGIFFIVTVDKQYKTFIENQIYAQYPEAQISEIKDYMNSVGATPGVIEVAELTLTKDSYLPIRTFQNFEVDPLAGVTASISKLPAGQEVFLQIVARPINNDWQKKGQEYVNKLRSGDSKDEKKPSLESGDKDIINVIENKNTKLGFQFVIRIMAKSHDRITSQRLIQEATAAFSQYQTSLFNSLGAPKKPKLNWAGKFRESLRRQLLGKRLDEKLNLLQKFGNRYLDEFAKGIINTEEFASLYHLPNRSVETPNISWARSKKLEYPLNIPSDKSARLLAMTDYRGVNIRYGIKAEDRLRHMYVIGKTGVGKSKFLEGIALGDIYAGNGVGFMDPHGDTIDYILERIPAHRKDDVILFDPGDTDYPVAFNLLETKEGEDKSLIADGIVTVFKKQFGNSWGPRLEYILGNAVLTLLHAQNVSLMVLPRLLTDDNYRKFLLKQVKDPILLKFWTTEYEPLARDQRRRDAEIASIMNKVGRFTTNPMIRNIIGQVRSSLDIKDIMDNRKILLINLSQGRVGEENMALLGGMIITRMYSAVTQRAKQQDRQPFYLFVDEFQNFSTNTFEKILSEARKYGLGLIVAHQFMDQLEEGIRNAIFGNVGTMVNFAVGPKDAEFLVKQYTPYLEAEDLVNLGRQKIVNKLSIDLAQSKPFTATTLTHNFPKTGLYDEITEMSRKKYAKPREYVAQKLYKWADTMYNLKGNLMTAEEVEEERQRAERRVLKKMGKLPRKNKPDDKDNSTEAKQTKPEDNKKGDAKNPTGQDKSPSNSDNKKNSNKDNSDNTRRSRGRRNSKSNRNRNSNKKDSKPQQQDPLPPSSNQSKN